MTEVAAVAPMEASVAAMAPVEGAVEAPKAAPRRPSSGKTSPKKPELEAEIEILNQLQHGQYQATAAATTTTTAVEIDYTVSDVAAISQSSTEAAPLEKPKRRMKMPTAADTVDAAAAATAAAAARQQAEEEVVMLQEMTRMTKVLDEKLDVLDAFEIEARLRLNGVEQAVKAVERLAASRRVGVPAAGGQVVVKEAAVASVSKPKTAAAVPSVAAAAVAVTAAEPMEKETKERIDSLLSSLSLLEKSLDVLYFLEFETVNEEAQIKRLINIANKIHSHAESKERLVTQLVEKRQSLELLEKESNIIIAKTETLKRKIHGSNASGGYPLPTTKEDEAVMRKLTNRIEESVNTLAAIELSTVELTGRTEQMIKIADRMASRRTEMSSTVATPEKIEKQREVGEEAGEKEKEEQRMKLLMVTLKEIGAKTSLMEEMEMDARNMLRRAETLQTRIRDLEMAKRWQEEEAKKKAQAAPKMLVEKKTDYVLHSATGTTTMQTATGNQDLARVSIMADVKQVKDAIMQEELPSQQIQQMKDMVQDEINQDREVEQEIQMREHMHLKEKERQRELIKQIRLMEEIEEIQQEHDREQFYHEQEQEMRIQEKEMEHERSREHNLALMHQLELMTQINLIQDTVMILDEVQQMDASQEQIISYNLQKIEKHLEILDEIERGTAIATTRVDVLFDKIKKVESSRALAPKPHQVKKKVTDSIRKSPSDVDTVAANIENIQTFQCKVTEKLPILVEKKRTLTDANLENVCKELSKIEMQLERLEGMKAATSLEVERSDWFLGKVGGAEKSKPLQTITLTQTRLLPEEICDPMNLSAALLKVEKRLTDLGDLHRAIGVQTDVVEGTISRVKTLEQRLMLQEKAKLNVEMAQPLEEATIQSSVSQVQQTQTHHVAVKPATPKIPEAQYPSGEMLHSISVIETKVDELDRLYDDVRNLRGQTEVLGEEFNKVEKRKLLASQMVTQPETPVASAPLVSVQQTLTQQEVVRPVSQEAEEAHPSGAMLHSISVIEAKVDELDRLYDDVRNLRGQTEVLGEEIDKVEKRNLHASQMATSPATPAAPVSIISPEKLSKTSLVMTETKEEPSTGNKDQSLMAGLRQNLSKIEDSLTMLQGLEQATALDVDRSEVLLSRVSNLERALKGSTSVSMKMVDQVPSTSLVNISKSMDIISYLTAIERRLSLLDDLRRQKGLQSELIDSSILRIKRIEQQLKKSGIQHEKAPEDNRNVDELFTMIIRIEQKVSILESLYQEVNVLQSQAEVLGDNIQVYESWKLNKNKAEQDDALKSGNKQPNSSTKLDGAMENIAILEKEISDLLKESEMGSLGKRLDSMEEWEVVDKQSIQHEMEQTMPQCMTSGDLAKMKVGKGLQRCYSAETTELMAKVDGMKESVEEQKALRMLERENSLEFLDYGGTGGPVEQEAALLLERVDQGFTQIIRDQSETHLMSSLKKELTPEKLDADSDTSLADHEREKLHQQQLMKQIQEMQQTAFSQEEMEADVSMASMDGTKQEPSPNHSEAMINIVMKRKSVMDRQKEIQTRMEDLKATLSLMKDMASADLKMHDDETEGDMPGNVMEAEMRKQISLMQKDSKLLDVELENIALQERKLLEGSSMPAEKPFCSPLVLSPMVQRKRRSCEPEGLPGMQRSLSIEFQRMMMEIGKPGSMESLYHGSESGKSESGRSESESESAKGSLMNLLPKGGRIDPDLVLDPISAMHSTIANMKEDDLSQPLVRQLDFLSHCLDAVAAQIQCLQMRERFAIEEEDEEDVICSQCKQELPKDAF